MDNDDRRTKREQLLATTNKPSKAEHSLELQNMRNAFHKAGAALQAAHRCMGRLGLDDLQPQLRDIQVSIDRLECEVTNHAGDCANTQGDQHTATLA